VVIQNLYRVEAVTFETKGAPLWIIGLIIVLQPAEAMFLNQNAAALHRRLTPLSHATYGLLNMNFAVNGATLIGEVCVLLLWLGHLRPADIGWRSRDVWPAVLFTLLLWLAGNLGLVASALFQGAPLAFDPHWKHPSQYPGVLIGVVFGNALGVHSLVDAPMSIVTQTYAFGSYLDFSDLYSAWGLAGVLV
jgi:hypothetical protein